MSAAKHTPGPWVLQDDGSIASADAGMICNPAYAEDFPCLDDEERGPFDDECQANARLIVAAPELLEAAENGLASLETELGLILESHCKLDTELEPIRETLDEDVRDLVEALEAKIAQARAAIARATGAA